MTFENRLARIEAKNTQDTGAGRQTGRAARETGTGTLLLWGLFFALVWAGLAYPFGALLAAIILAPLGAILLVPWLLLRRRTRSPERSALLDLLDMLNPLS